MAGRLTTVRLEPADSGTPLAALLDLLASSEGGVVLIDLGGRDDCQCWGSVLATAAARYGVAGALINGGARDVDELARLGFPTYARGVYPAAIRGRLRFAAANEPVVLDDVSVQPGSFAVADASGAIFLPLDHADAVLARATELRISEHQALEDVGGGADPRDVFVRDQHGSERGTAT